MKTTGRSLPDSLLEFYLADALSPEAKERCEEILAKSPADQTRLKELRADSEAFRVQRSPTRLIARYLSAVRVSVLEGPWSTWNGLVDGLKGDGLQVTAVTRDVRLLLDSMETDPPQVAILDVEADNEAVVGCSVSEGLNLLREARKRRLEVRMLMLSAVSTPEVISQCFDEGVAGYLFRAGLGVPSVVSAVQGLVRGERLFPVQLLRNDLEAPPVKPQQSSVLHSLTQREREVLMYVAGGADNLKIAAHLQIAERTVKSHVTQLYRKLGAENRDQLAQHANHLGVHAPPKLPPKS